MAPIGERASVPWCDKGGYSGYALQMGPRARPQLRNVAWDSLAPEARTTLNAGIEEAERAEFADLSPDETEHYLKTGELPERVERWLDSYDSRPRT
jgi:hypothetical protein